MLLVERMPKHLQQYTVAVCHMHIRLWIHNHVKETSVALSISVIKNKAERASVYLVNHALLFLQ